MTIDEMLNRYEQALVRINRTDSTRRTYRIPIRVVRNVFGGGTSLQAITQDKMAELFELLRRVPTNATQKYPNLSLIQAVEEADKTGNLDRLSPKSVKNYIENISTVFKFAVESGWMAKNPASNKYLRPQFDEDEDVRPKELFKVNEINQLFRTPLYVGCVDDGRNYGKPGPNKPRRGRFWVPLIALWQGVRCNEATQLYTEDIGKEEGIPYFDVRENRADGSKCDKRLKTKQSKRRVPIHPELLKIGFLDYVQERRRDCSHPRLFPDLPCGANGYFSGPFSKWFSRFARKALGEDCEATFHSFRHSFRDALEEADAPISVVERLGGWEVAQRSAEKGYGRGPSLRRLRDHLEKVTFAGLDLSHLQPD